MYSVNVFCYYLVGEPGNKECLFVDAYALWYSEDPCSL